MLSWFGPREALPGRGAGGYEPSDTATFREIWLAARVVERDCLLPTRRPGWEVVGETQNTFFHPSDARDIYCRKSNMRWSLYI